jgi:hypothetical protein
VKTPEQVTADITRRLAGTWHADAAAAAADGGANAGAWPHAFALGEPSKAELQDGFAAIQAAVLDWHAWARTHQVELRVSNRRVHGTTQPLPTHAVVPDVDTAARVVGPAWVARLDVGRARARLLTVRFPQLVDLAAVVRQVDGWSDVDVGLACTAGQWFATNDAMGLTPRQVPLEGFHAKWLNTHRPVVAALAGRDDLGLVTRHASRIHFTYLDPKHRAAGGRWHDSATVGDAMQPAYTPQVVLISENKDTSVMFGPVPGGISVEGDGAGAAAYATFDWLTACPVLLYWGDIDADGLAILNEFRRAGVPARSILMDTATMDRFAPFAATTDRRGRPLEAVTRRVLPTLTASERAVYALLTDPKWKGPRRIEQERIPLEEARAIVLTELATAGST